MARRRSFGSVYRKPRREGGFYPGYYVRWREGGRRIEKGSFTTKDAAETFLGERRRERSERRALGLSEVRRETVRSAVARHLEWMKAHLRKTTVVSRVAPLKVFVSEHGDRDVCTLTGDDVLRAIEAGRKSRGWCAATQHSVLAIFAAFASWAVAEGIARTSFARRLDRRLPRRDTNAPRYLAPPDLRAIYAAVPKDILPIVFLMGEAGLRRNEAVFLEHGEVARDRRSITLRAERSKGHRSRTVPLTDTAAAALSAVLDAQATPINRTARVFGVSSWNLNREFRAAMQRIGRTDVTPHTLRHAFGSGLVRAGVDVATVMHLMGHRSLAVTQRYAVHAPSDAASQAIQALERSRAQATPRRDDRAGTGSTSGV